MCHITRFQPARFPSFHFCKLFQEQLSARSRTAIQQKEALMHWHTAPRRFRWSFINLLGIVVLLTLAALSVSGQSPTFTDPGFAWEVVATLTPYTTVGLTFTPDGRLLVWQKQGVVRVIKNGALLPEPFLDISARVNNVNQRGLLGLALDPNFASNGSVYLYYVYENTGNPNDQSAKTARVTRVTVDPNNPDVALPESEVVILGSISAAPCSNYPDGADCIGADSDSHNGGTIRFAPDGTMFISIGDGAEYNFVDAQALRSQNLNRYEGKLIRIKTDGTAPPDNPFYDGDPHSVRSKIYAYGLRNPYRFALHPVTGEPYVGDVGWGTYEEVNRGRGANFGWPCYEGNFPQPTYQARFPQCQGLLPGAVTPPIQAYDRSLGRSVIGGTFYSATQFPAQYRGNFFFGDFNGQWIRRMIFDANGDVAGVQPFFSTAGLVVSVESGPDGSLYYVELYNGQVRRIRYTSAPVAVAAVSQTNGASPLSISFSSSGSYDPDGEALSYFWDFGDGTTSTDPAPQHVYITAGMKTFIATLTVTDARGLSSSGKVSVTVNNKPPIATITSPVSGSRIGPGARVTFTGLGADPDEALPSEALRWQVLLHHDDHIHPFINLTGPTGRFVAEDHGPGLYYYEIILTVADSAGVTDTQRVNVYYALPEPWVSSDISEAAIPGDASHSSGVWTLASSGQNISGTWDGFHFAYQLLSGDGQIVARVLKVENTNPDALAGVMIRSSLRPDAAHATMYLTPEDEIGFRRRTASGGSSPTSYGYRSSAPWWVKLVREGRRLSGYHSGDGVNWIFTGSERINMPRAVWIGLVVTSYDRTQLCTATFDNVTVSQAPASGRNGLRGDYFSDHDFTEFRFSRTDAEVDFDFGLDAPGNLPDQDKFAIRWTGYVHPDSSENYTFHTLSDDGVRLWVDGKLLIDNWTGHAPTEDQGEIRLEAGKKYRLRLEYFEGAQGAQIRLLWSAPNQPKEVIPQHHLFTP
jgi:glucose/arabinose dehydrogenase